VLPLVRAVLWALPTKPLIKKGPSPPSFPSGGEGQKRPLTPPSDSPLYIPPLIRKGGRGPYGDKGPFRVLNRKGKIGAHPYFKEHLVWANLPIHL